MRKKSKIRNIPQFLSMGSIPRPPPLFFSFPHPFFFLPFPSIPSHSFQNPSLPLPIVPICISRPFPQGRDEKRGMGVEKNKYWFHTPIFIFSLFFLAQFPSYPSYPPPSPPPFFPPTLKNPLHPSPISLSFPSFSGEKLGEGRGNVPKRNNGRKKETKRAFVVFFLNICLVWVGIGKRGRGMGERGMRERGMGERGKIVVAGGGLGGGEMKRGEKERENRKECSNENSSTLFLFANRRSSFRVLLRGD